MGEAVLTVMLAFGTLEREALIERRGDLVHRPKRVNWTLIGRMPSGRWWSSPASTDSS